MSKPLFTLAVEGEPIHILFGTYSTRAQQGQDVLESFYRINHTQQYLGKGTASFASIFGRRAEKVTPTQVVCGDTRTAKDKVLTKEEAVIALEAYREKLKHDLATVEMLIAQGKA